MDKSMICFVILFMCLACANCINEQNKETVKWIIDKPNEEKVISVKLKKTFHFQEMEIVENTLEDTCIIGIMKIPPGTPGRLYRTEFLSDSLMYKYIPFKASKGKLIVEHSFMDF